MQDLISRQAAIDALRETENHAFNSFYQGLIKAHKIIAGLPSAQPEPKTGRWASFTEYLKHLEETTGTKYDFYRQKHHDDFVFCSRCWQMKNRYENWKYCPDCGSYNGGEE